MLFYPMSVSIYILPGFLALGCQHLHCVLLLVNIYFVSCFSLPFLPTFTVHHVLLVFIMIVNIYIVPCCSLPWLSTVKFGSFVLYLVCQHLLLSCDSFLCLLFMSSFSYLSSCGGPAISHHYTVSLVQWVNICFLSRGQRFWSWGCTNSQWNRVSPVSVVSLHWWPRCDWSLASP